METKIKQKFLMACIKCNHEWMSKSDIDNQECPKCKAKYSTHDDVKQFGCNGTGTCSI